MQSETHDLENMLEALCDAASDSGGEVTLGDVVDVFAERSFGALLTMAALFAALPVIGAIPGVSILTGSLILLIAIQFLVGRTSIWIPQALRERSLSAEAVAKAATKAKPYAARIDQFVKPRLMFLAQGPVARTAIAIGGMLLALLFYPAAIIPWAVWAPALSVMALGLALVGRDGVFAIIGMAGAAISVAVAVSLL